MILAICHAEVCLGATAPVSCTGCHTGEARLLASSVHTKLDCRECHGGDETYALSADEAEKIMGASRGGSAVFEHGASFRGALRRQDIPETCGGCHANVERMNPYGLRTDQLARYWTSGHGKTLKTKGDERVAVCVDCHGTHDVMSAKQPESRTHPLNVPGTCATCHSDVQLMGEYGLPVEVMDEYRESVHGRLLFEQHDTGAPTCATCHGNHSAVPPGFATIGAVCGQCHARTEEYFAVTTHASQPEYEGCVQCHGGGEGRHFHLIERITNPAGLMVQRYARLLRLEPNPTPEQITAAIHPVPTNIINGALSACLECHEEPEEDESLAKIFTLIEMVAEAERIYVKTGEHLREAEQGVLLVENQRFKFEDAKTHLIELAPLQHTLDTARVGEKVAEMKRICAEVDSELTDLEKALSWRHRALIPIWAFTLVFAAVLYAKYKQLKARYVEPLAKHR